ncbi:hypothetical protein JCM5296_001341 [Sporobolomyces johnsonii]
MSLPLLSYAQAQQCPAQFVHELRQALLTTGFLYLTEIEQVLPGWTDAWDAAFRASEEFFQRPLEEKMQIGMLKSRHFRGYSAVGAEVTAGKVDQREQIDLAPDTPPAVPHPRPSSADEHPIFLSLYGPNQYPSASVPSFEPAIKTYRALCSTVARSLVSLLAQSLSPEPELITSLFESSNPLTPDYSRMKVVRYPPVPSGVQGLGVGAHKDGGGITLLAQDQTGGLQVQTWAGEWIDVEPRAHDLVINVGQVIERLSSGLYPATTHRVLPTLSPSPRLSIPFFFSPVLTAPLSPLSPSHLHASLLVKLGRVDIDIVSEVRKGDLHEDVFGRAAWRGITRSHGDVWARWYGREVDELGGPEDTTRTESK